MDILAVIGREHKFIPSVKRKNLAVLNPLAESDGDSMYAELPGPVTMAQQG